MFLFPGENKFYKTYFGVVRYHASHAVSSGLLVLRRGALLWLATYNQAPFSGLPMPAELVVSQIRGLIVHSECFF